MDAIRAIVKERGIKTAAFDHHEPTHNDELALLVNRGVAAASQEVYHLCFDVLGLQPPKGYEQMTMLAILDDTDRFKYHYPNYTETLQIAGKLIDSGIDVQKLDARLRRFTVDQMLIMGHLASNIHAEEGYTYSYISDEYAAEWVRAGKAIADIRLGRAYFVDHFIRNISDNLWGFVVFPDLTAPTGTYYASFRATRGSMNVETIGTSFGGGGHSESAGAKILAPNVDQAIRQVQAAIKQMH